MAKGNLKGLGPSIGPRNSLSRTSGGSAVTERSSKRQKLDISPPPTVRIPASIPSTSSQSNPEPKRDTVDLYEIDSNSTGTRSGKQTNVASQHQFRRLSQFSSSNPKKARVRKDRQARQSAGASSQGSPVVDLEESRTSPDPLAHEPPPAEITSDIAPSRGSGKRQRQSSVPEPHVKRAKTTSSRRESIDNSADELSLEANGKLRSKKQKDNIATSGEERQAHTRADIQRTQFTSGKDKKKQHQAHTRKPEKPLPIARAGKDKKKQHQAHTRKPEKPLPIARAVCAAHSIQSTPVKTYSYVPSYNSEGQLVELQPRLENDDKAGNDLQNFVDDEEATMTAVGIDFAKVRGVRHLMTRSKYLVVNRSSSPGRPAQLCVEMSSVAECSRLIALFPAQNCHEFDGESLEKTFEHSWNVAADRQRQSASQAKSPSTNKLLFDQDRRHIQNDLVVEIPSQRESRSTRRLIDQLAGGQDETKEERVTSDLTKPPSESSPVATPIVPRVRRTRQSTATNQTEDGTTSAYFTPQPSITRWTFENPDWQSRWPKSLVYPATGRSRAVVDADDIPRLDDGECLNDNIINFYLRWLKVGLQREKPAILEKVHVFESYFFERLKTSKYQGVRSWTAKVDLLSYDYIVVPVNENFHWYLAIICNVAKALPQAASRKDDADQNPDNGDQAQTDESSPKVKVIRERVKAITIDDDSQKSPSTAQGNADDSYAVQSSPTTTRSGSTAPRPKPKKTSAVSQKFDPNAPRIITLDSLGNPHSATCRILREYLSQEAEDKKGIELEGAVPGMTAKGIPFQGNGYDCGTYTLAFVEKFLNDPDQVSQQLLQKENVDWDVDSAVIRKDIRNLLFALQQEQQERFEQELAEKKARKRGKSTSGAMSSPGPIAIPTASQEANRAAALKEVASSPSGGRSGVDVADVDDSDTKNQSTPVTLKTPKTDEKSREVSIENGSPRLLSPLANSDDNTAGERSEAFFSARGTPTPKRNGVNKQPPSSAKSPSKQASTQPPLIQQIPNTDSEPEEVGHKQQTKKTRKKQSDAGEEPIRHSIEESDEKPIQRSVELDEERPRPKSSDSHVTESGKKKSIQRSVEQDEENPRPTTTGGVFDSLRKVKDSLWGSPKGKEKKRASYEGIDRS